MHHGIIYIYLIFFNIIINKKRCGHCKSFAPIYEAFAEKIAAENPNIIIADVDATENEVEGVDI